MEKSHLLKLSMGFIKLFLLIVLCGVAFMVHIAEAQEDSDLAKKTQNPVGDLISIPFQNNFNFGVGPNDDMQYILNIQPVYPMSIGEKWNWIHRPIIPLMYQPELAPGIGDEFGLGDIQYQGYLSPARPGKLIWGVGAVLAFPTATDESLGTEKWLAGPGVVLLTSNGPWVFGALVNNVWSIAGDDDRADVSMAVIQPFVNYNLPGGLYFMTAPIITANWEADSDNAWTIPLGAGIGKIFRVGKVGLPINTSVRAYYNVEHPENAADWSATVQFQLLLPK